MEKKISYEPYKNIKGPNLVAYLFSNVFAYLLYQRGHIVLHASAIEIDQKAYFFLEEVDWQIKLIK